jgi:flagellar P-ring protein precursor FlgI
MMLNLHAGDFSTASRVAQRINTEMGAGSAWPLDAISVEVRAPQDPAQRVTYLSMIENLEFTPAEAPARVIINSRTGTVVIGANVRVSPAAVSHGSLVVTISEDFNVSQPGPFSPQGQTVVTPDSNIEISEDGGHMFLFNPDVSLDSIVRAVNEVGAAPGDLVAILEALKQSGSLHAELIVI